VAKNPEGTGTKLAGSAGRQLPMISGRGGGARYLAQWGEDRPEDFGFIYLLFVFGPVRCKTCCSRRTYTTRFRDLLVAPSSLSSLPTTTKPNHVSVDDGLGVA